MKKDVKESARGYSEEGFSKSPLQLAPQKLSRLEIRVEPKQAYLALQ